MCAGSWFFRLCKDLYILQFSVADLSGEEGGHNYSVRGRLIAVHFTDFNCLHLQHLNYEDDKDEDHFWSLL